MEPTSKKAGVLSERNMRWYLGGQLFSLTGTMLQTAVLSLLILEIAGKTNGAFWVGVVYSLDLIPGCILGPFAGIILDRFNKKNILIFTSFCGVIQTALLAFLTFTHQITILEICILALIMGIVNAIDGPGRNVIIKDAVINGHNIRPASKMFTSLYNLAQVAGPGLAGFLILTFGYPITFVINGLSFVALIIALLNMKLVVQNSMNVTTQTNILTTLRTGAIYTFKDQSIRLSIFLTFFLCVFGFFYYPILPVIAKELFKGGPLVYSYLAAASGIGSFIGALLIINFNKKFSHKFLVIAGTICMGLALWMLSYVSSLLLGILLIGFIGFCFLISFSSLRSSIIHLAKQEYMGIVMGYTFTFFYGGMMLGSFGAGTIANIHGSSFVLVCGGIILTLIGCIIPFLPGINNI